MRLIVTLRGLHPNTAPRKVGQFEHVAARGGYLYQGREFTPEEFNILSSSREWDRLIESHGPRVSVRVVHTIEATAPESPVPAKGNDPIAPPVVKNKGGRPRKVQPQL